MMLTVEPTLGSLNACVYLDYDHPAQIPVKLDGWTRFVCISDTHSQIHWDHEHRMPRGDVLIHAGDLSSWGRVEQLEKTIKWLGSLEGYASKLFIAGNHDMWLDRESEDLKNFSEDERNEMMEVCQKMMAKSRLREKGLKYIQYEETRVKADEKQWTVYGSPASPRHSEGSFQYSTEEQAEEINARIPQSTEILITHTPPYGTLDRTRKEKHAGCRNLKKHVNGRLKNCRLHIFGHIHEAHGATIRSAKGGNAEMVIVNAAIHHRGKPIVVDLRNRMV